MATTSTSIFLLLISLFNLLLFPPTQTTAFDNITAIFTFGDSILDPGNNNCILTSFKANHPPYGRDFPGRIPTGRFSNGKLVPDFLVSKLGIKELLPAYLDPLLTNQDLLTGCSFASGSAGLDDLTSIMSHVISLMTQLSHFKDALVRMKSVAGTKEVGRVVENALFLVAAGTNDMILNFYPLPLRKNYSLDDYHDLLLRNLEAVIRKLYYMGARKIGITGLPPIGCLPLQMTIASLTPSLDILQRKCVKQQNIDSQSYNAKLIARTSSIQQTLPGSRIVYVDIYKPLMDFIANSTAYGFERSNVGCCGTGLLEAGYLCNSLEKVCADPSKYVFWDAVHPSQATYSYAANYFMKNVLPNFAL